MHAIAQEDDEHVAGRIDPERGAGETRVAKRAERKQIAAIGRETVLMSQPRPRVQPFR